MEDSAQAIIEEYRALTATGFTVVASIVLIYYDYCITLDREVTMFWRRKLNGAAILFYTNRYFFVLWNLFQIPTTLFATLGGRPISDETCAMFAKVGAGIGFFPYLMWAAFSTLRAYALSGSRALSTLVFLLSIVDLGVNLGGYGYDITGFYVPRIGCVPINHASRAVAKSFTIASRTCLMAADILLVLITWFTLSRRSRGVLNRRGTTLSGVLLRDGMIYFVVLFALNLLHLTLTLLSIVSISTEASYVTVFTDPITSVLATRFLLDLQASERKALDLVSSGGLEDEQESSESSSVVFNGFLGSLGSTIVTENSDYEDEQNISPTISLSTRTAEEK